MAIPFILHSLPCSSIFLQQGVNLTFEGDDSLLRLLLITSQNAWFARHIIIYSGTMFLHFRVYFITS